MSCEWSQWSTIVQSRQTFALFHKPVPCSLARTALAPNTLAIHLGKRSKIWRPQSVLKRMNCVPAWKLNLQLLVKPLKELQKCHHQASYLSQLYQCLPEKKTCIHLPQCAAHIWGTYFGLLQTPNRKENVCANVLSRRQPWVCCLVYLVDHTQPHCPSRAQVLWEPHVKKQNFFFSTPPPPTFRRRVIFWRPQNEIWRSWTPNGNIESQQFWNGPPSSEIIKEGHETIRQVKANYTISAEKNPGNSAARFTHGT